MPVSLIKAAQPIAWCGAPKSIILILLNDQVSSDRLMIANVPFASAAITLLSVPIKVTTESASRTWANGFSDAFPFPENNLVMGKFFLTFINKLSFRVYLAA